jgi:hypothetical protein
MDQNEEKIQRPKTLQILCILTFIGSGLSMLSYLIFAFALDVFKEVVQNNNFSFIKSAEDQALIELIFNLPRIYFVIHFIFYAASLIGAYLMWNLRKIGFHIYTIAQISLLIIYKIFVPSAPFPVFPLMVTVFFILLYFGNLKFMR